MEAEGVIKAGLAARANMKKLEFLACFLNTLIIFPERAL